MSWNSDAQVPSLVGRPLAEILQARERRQALDGFDEIYSDFVDYIARCTYRIWDEKNVGLIRTHYSSDCPVISLSGRLVGAEAMLQGTVSALAACPDRNPVAEDVIWCQEEPGVFFSSHRIMSTSSHLGPDAVLGSPTNGGRAPIPVIADCVCKNNRIIQEWLVRDYAQFVRQSGLSRRSVAERLARSDLEGDQERHSWLGAEVERVLGCQAKEPPPDHPAYNAAHALQLAFQEEQYGSAAELAADAIELR